MDGRVTLLPRLAGWNALCRSFGTPMAFGESLRITVAEAKAPDAVHLTARLPKYGHDIAVALDAFPFRELTGTPLTMDEVAVLPPAVAHELRRMAAGEIARAAGLQADFLRPEDPQDGWVWLSVAVDGLSGAAAQLRLGAPRGVFASLAQEALDAGALTGRGPGAAWAEGIRIGCALVMGSLTLGRARLQALTPGDILLPATTGLALQAKGITIALDRADTPAEEGEEGPAKARCIIREIAVTDDVTEQEDGAPVADLDALALTVSFSLGRREMSFAELRGLAAGGILDLDPPDAEPGLAVDILVQGRPAGQGHIVDIDGQPGIRIASLSYKGS